MSCKRVDTEVWMHAAVWARCRWRNSSGMRAEDVMTGKYGGLEVWRLDVGEASRRVSVVEGMELWRYAVGVLT